MKIRALSSESQSPITRSRKAFQYFDTVSDPRRGFQRFAFQEREADTSSDVMVKLMWLLAGLPIMEDERSAGPETAFIDF
jgi:hypothetical protein